MTSLLSCPRERIDPVLWAERSLSAANVAEGMVNLDPTYQPLMAQIRATDDPAERRELLRLLHDQMWREHARPHGGLVVFRVDPTNDVLVKLQQLLDSDESAADRFLHAILKRRFHLR